MKLEKEEPEKNENALPTQINYTKTLNTESENLNTFKVFDDIGLTEAKQLKEEEKLQKKIDELQELNELNEIHDNLEMNFSKFTFLSIFIFYFF